MPWRVHCWAIYRKGCDLISSEKGRLIVVVEDDEQVAKLIGLMIERAGFQTLTISDGREALDYVTSNEVSMVFADLGVKGLAGDQLCLRLKESQETKGVPVIVISGDRDVGRRAESCGADGFLEKPFEPADLVRLVDAHAENEKAT